MESRFKPGEIVWFQPHIDKIDILTGTTTNPEIAVKAKVLKVSISMDKVLYDLALFAMGGFYEMFPLKSVDSIFVCPIVEQKEPAQKESKSAKELLEEMRRRKTDYEISRPREQFPYFPQYIPPNWGQQPTPPEFPPGTIICDLSKMIRNH